jgi:uncharacterized repeat protein (TIGR03803 family)
MIDPRLALLASITCVTSYGHARAGGAPTYQVVYSFTNSGMDGEAPQGALTVRDGVIYGTTTFGGGSSGNGTIFSFVPSTGVETPLASFTGGLGGRNPINLTRVGSNLIVPLQDAGAGNNGAVGSFKIPTGKERTLYSFGASPDGEAPTGFVYVGGTLYGMTAQGGANGDGAIVSIDQKTDNEAVLYSFTGGNDGRIPVGSPAYVNGQLYGITEYGGGQNAAGTVFRFDPVTQTLTTLHSFLGKKDGAHPTSLTYTHGTLYGTTQFSGVGGYTAGTIFRVDPASGKFKVVYGIGDPAHTTGNIGFSPMAPVIYDSGLLLGTCNLGGDHQDGTVFEVDLRTGNASVIHAFEGQQNGAMDGSSPAGSLVKVGNVFYGTTFVGGTAPADGSGTIFSFTP